jgi:CBS domain-containing protein
MSEHDIRHIPVMSQIGVVGMVSARDVLRVLSSQERAPQRNGETCR